MRLNSFVTPGGQEVAMLSQRPRAFGLLIVGAILIGHPAAVVAFWPSGWTASPIRLILFLGVPWLIGALLCARGWSGLRQEKRCHPGQGWLQFLRPELAGLGLAIGLMVVLGAMPAAWREGLLSALRELETAIHITQGGHP